MGNTPRADLGWPKYHSTVTHGFGPVKMTPDLFDHKESPTAPNEQGSIKCSDIANARSSAVTGGSYDPARLEGLWYEAAYSDVAQVGAACQTLNFTFSEATGVLTAAFSVKYGPLPF